MNLVIVFKLLWCSNDSGCNALSLIFFNLAWLRICKHVNVSSGLEEDWGTEKRKPKREEKGALLEVYTKAVLKELIQILMIIIKVIEWQIMIKNRDKLSNTDRLIIKYGLDKLRNKSEINHKNHIIIKNKL